MFTSRESSVEGNSRFQKAESATKTFYFPFRETYPNLSNVTINFESACAAFKSLKSNSPDKQQNSKAKSNYQMTKCVKDSLFKESKKLPTVSDIFTKYLNNSGDTTRNHALYDQKQFWTNTERAQSRATTSRNLNQEQLAVNGKRPTKNHWDFVQNRTTFSNIRDLSTNFALFRNIRTIQKFGQNNQQTNETGNGDEALREHRDSKNTHENQLDNQFDNEPDSQLENQHKSTDRLNIQKLDKKLNLLSIYQSVFSKLSGKFTPINIETKLDRSFDDSVFKSERKSDFSEHNKIVFK